MYEAKSNPKGESNTKLEEILKNNWPVMFKITKVMKVRERLKNCFRLREIKRHDSEMQY